MKNMSHFLTMAAAVCMVTAATVARSQDLQDPEIGAAAPAFTLPAIDGETVSLSDFSGKIVVLEWINHGCPFVRKFYSVGKMQAWQQAYRDKGIVWLAICSSAPGQQGYYSLADWPAVAEKHKMRATAVLVDEKGVVGRAYGARTTPHMFIIDKDGTLVYKGGIDDNRSASSDAIKGARNYVVEALDLLLEGKPVAETSTRPYGCSVKYAN